MEQGLSRKYQCHRHLANLSTINSQLTVRLCTASKVPFPWTGPRETHVAVAY